MSENTNGTSLPLEALLDNIDVPTWVLYNENDPLFGEGTEAKQFIEQFRLKSNVKTTIFTTLYVPPFINQLEGWIPAYDITRRLTETVSSDGDSFDQDIYTWALSK